MSLKKSSKSTKKPKLKNKFEGKIFEALEKKRVRFKYEGKRLPYLIAGHYLPDFPIELPTGDWIYLETKGYFRPDAKRKLVAVKKLNPTIDIRLIFYAHREKDIRWAERYGFKWCVQEIPDEWFYEFKH